MKRTLYSLALLIVVSLTLFGCFPQQQQQSQPTAEKQPIDISWVPKHIPKNGIVNPHNLIDEATINKIKEINEKWIKDPIPVQVTVVIVEETLFSHSVSEINKIMLDS